MSGEKRYVSVVQPECTTDELVRLQNPENELVGKLVSVLDGSRDDVRDLVELNPVGDDGEAQFTEWECEPSQTQDGKPLKVEESDGKWIACAVEESTGEAIVVGGPRGNSSSVVLSWDGETPITARREVANLAGYRLGPAGGQNEGKMIGVRPNLLRSVTWDELVEIRDSGKLLPGYSYRITDYVATTNGDMDSVSANHPFDVVVRAMSSGSLSEIAYAIQHEGDDYFADSNLASWQLWYCLDNDDSRFAWADPDGKGVVFRLVDEFNNDAPYDFKGIQFNTHEDGDVFRYTFDDGAESGLNSDTSIHGIDNGVYDNGILSWTDLTKPVKRQYLNHIVILGRNNYAISMSHGCHNIVLGKLGRGVPGQCSHNKFGQYCRDISLGNRSQSNVFEDLCYGIEAQDNCNYNRFQISCYAIQMGNNCNHNVFSTYCSSIQFGSFCAQNTVGNSSVQIFAGDYIRKCMFGKSVRQITFGQTTSGGPEVQSYYESIEVEDGVMWVDLYCSADRKVSPMDSTLSPYRQVTVKKGVKGTGAATPKLISDANFNQTFNTVYQPQGQQTISI